MDMKQLIETADSLGILHYNENPKYICLHGINGHASILYTDDPSNREWEVPATMVDFANHLKQMGRDSLKMELHSLLSITLHN